MQCPSDPIAVSRYDHLVTVLDSIPNGHTAKIRAHNELMESETALRAAIIRHAATVACLEDADYDGIDAVKSRAKAMLTNGTKHF